MTRFAAARAGVVRQSLFVLFALFAFPVFAQVPPATYYEVSLSTGVYRGTEADAVCQAKVADYNRNSTSPWSGAYAAPSGSSGGYCQFRTSTGALSSAGQYFKITCPTTRPYFNGTSCVAESPPPSCPKDTPGTGTWYHSTGPEDSNLNNANSPAVTGGCVQSCVVTMTDIHKCYRASDGKNYCTYSYKSTGGVCAVGGSQPSPQSPAPSADGAPRIDVPPFSSPSGKCPTGTIQGGVDSAGTPICIGTGSDPKNAPPPPPKIETEKSEAQPDGSTKHTKTETITNSDGSTTTNTTVTITRPDGSKETSGGTVTSTTPKGTAGKADTPEKDQYDLCKQNPMLTICRNSSVAGTCGQITCVGDAIQCATLRAAAAMQCQQQADKEALTASPSKSLGEQVLSGNDPMKGDIAAALKGSEVDLSSTALDQSGFVGGGACFPDKTFTVVGKTVTVSFSRVCQDIQPLRAVIMACAFIVAYLIVGRSVIQG